MTMDSLAFWNSQLQLSAFVPEFDTWPPRYEALSRATRERRGEPSRLATGDDPFQAVSRFATGRPSHRVIFIHGGYWRRFEAADYDFVAEAAAVADAEFYNVDYRLLPGVRMADAVADAVRGVEKAMEGAERTVVVGHSAGAHLAVEAAQRSARTPDAVLAISGIYELAPLRSAFIQDELHLTDEEVAAFSPQTRAGALSFPVHIAAGADESVEFCRQSARLYDAIVTSGGTASLEFVPGRHHTAVITDLAEPDTSLTRRLVALLAG